ncbi:amidinotransferase [Telmatocola sphagniphila]|uniref:Amidinotransferase n=1 Tax=Telmatocola sphagniphila TaxID=1123043 RepID=A0A8E6B5Z5_9BACT|nr:arginine deiminase-related protein [Telmatocola sphagniphila]QVL32517.1 amidinotransferase [Telmatocola sphagniphila]
MSPRILMCPPDHYGIEYEINPWMNRSMSSVRDLAFKQWRALRDAIVSLGVRVEEMVPVAGLPDLVFTANAGLMFHNKFFSSQFKHDVRAKESPHFDAWFAKNGFEVHHWPSGMYHEGAGDALFCGNALFAGYRTRSDVHAHQWLAEQIGMQVLPVELVNTRFYHLDTCFCPLAPGLALYHPEAFDDYGQKVIRSNVNTLISVCEPEAWRFGCNAVVVGKSVIHNAGCPQLARDLTKIGYQSIEVELDEFLKAGGSAKCLTLRLDGEEAAGWKCS